MKVRTQMHSGWWYTVVSGDSLFKIAKRYYGDGNLWTQIYNYKKNRKIIGSNPDLIRPGMQIELW